jgi:hypothetical protein
MTASAAALHMHRIGFIVVSLSASVVARTTGRFSQPAKPGLRHARSGSLAPTMLVNRTIDNEALRQHVADNRLRR